MYFFVAPPSPPPAYKPKDVNLICCTRKKKTEREGRVGPIAAVAGNGEERLEPNKKTKTGYGPLFSASSILLLIYVKNGRKVNDLVKHI